MESYFLQLLQVVGIGGGFFILLGCVVGRWIWRGNKKILIEMEEIGNRVNGDMREVRKAWRETEQYLHSIETESRK